MKAYTWTDPRNELKIKRAKRAVGRHMGDLRVFAETDEVLFNGKMQKAQIELLIAHAVDMDLPTLKRASLTLNQIVGFRTEEQIT